MIRVMVLTSLSTIFQLYLVVSFIGGGNWSIIFNKFNPYIQYTPSVSTIILSGRTYSSQNVRQIWESTLSKFDYLVGHESGYLKIFFTFLEVNMSNILWSMRICKRTFFQVCRMSGYVNTLVYFYLAPYSCQEG